MKKISPQRFWCALIFGILASALYMDGALASLNCEASFVPLPGSAGPEARSDFFNIEPWLELETRIASKKILENMSRPDGLPGAIIAARTRAEPDYYFHWIRDAGLVVEAILGPARTGDFSNLVETRRKVLEYVAFSERVQYLETLTGLGEPKVNVDGTPFHGPWGRPQNDSPALRAISIVEIADQMNMLGLSRLSELGLDGILKRDLDYISDNWKKPSWDLWEEVLGDHFYTRMVQRRALLEGAEWIGRFGDVARRDQYRLAAKEIEATLGRFWSEDKQTFIATLPREPNADPSVQYWGLESKTSNIDIAVILGLLHGRTNDRYLQFSDRNVTLTIDTIESTFKNLYAINSRADLPGVAIGRYPEDMFGGADRSGGNPWVLATLAMAEASYRAAALQPTAQLKAAWMDRGDSYIARVKRHAHENGSLNEQYHRDNGYMKSVEDLTWSYAALLTAARARKEALK